LKNVRCPCRSTPHKCIRCIFRPLRAIRRIAWQSQNVTSGLFQRPDSHLFFFSILTFGSLFRWPSDRRRAESSAEQVFELAEKGTGLCRGISGSSPPAQARTRRLGGGDVRQRRLCLLRSGSPHRTAGTAVHRPFARRRFGAQLAPGRQLRLYDRPCGGSIRRHLA